MAETPEGRWQLHMEKLSEAEVLERIRANLEKDSLTDPAERQAFAEAVFAEHPKWVESWERGKACDRRTKVGKVKLKARKQLLDEALAAGQSLS